MLGLSTVDTDFALWRAKNTRRHFSTLFPPGRAPLAALLSLVDSDPTDGVKFDWLEDRYIPKQANTKINTLGGGAFASTVPATTNPFVATVGTNFRVYTDNALGQVQKFRPGETVVIQGVETSANGFVNVSVEVVSVDASSNFITVKPLEAGSYVNGTSSIGHTILPLGNIVAEGSSFGTQQDGIRYPIRPENYTQIIRDWMIFTANSLRQPMEFESTGVYKTKTKQTWFTHAENIENALLFGTRNAIAETLADGTASERRYTGGVEWFLQEWQKANGGAAGYRPGGSAILPAAGTFNVTGQRIFRAAASGAITKADWEDSILPGIFTNTSNTSHYKLLVGGQSALLAISRFYLGKSIINRDLQDKYKVDLQVHEVETELGTFGLLTHPKFTSNPTLRNSFMALEFQNLRLRPVTGRDTAIRTNQHERGYDGRKDDMLTEFGLELQYPETHAMVHGLKSITP